MPSSSRNETKQCKCHKKVTFLNCESIPKIRTKEKYLKLCGCATPYPKEFTKCYQNENKINSKEKYRISKKKSTQMGETIQEHEENIKNSLEDVNKIGESTTITTNNSRSLNQPVQNYEGGSNGFMVPPKITSVRDLIAHSLDYAVRQGILEKRGDIFIWKPTNESSKEYIVTNPSEVKTNVIKKQFSQTENTCNKDLQNEFGTNRNIQQLNDETIQEPCRKDNLTSFLYRFNNNQGNSTLHEYKDKRIYTIKPYIPKSHKGKKRKYDNHSQNLDVIHIKGSKDKNDLCKKNLVRNKSKSNSVMQQKHSSIYGKTPAGFKRPSQRKMHQSRKSIRNRNETKKKYKSSSSSLSDVPIAKIHKKKNIIKKKRVESPKSMYSSRSGNSSVVSLAEYTPIRNHHTKNPKLVYTEEKSNGLRKKRKKKDKASNCTELSEVKLVVKRKRQIKENKRKKFQ